MKQNYEHLKGSIYAAGRIVSKLTTYETGDCNRAAAL
jgi:hypothetical protein